MLNMTELVALRMVTRMGPLSHNQLRRLFGPDWKRMMLKLEMQGLVYIPEGGTGYQATDQGERVAA
jgi:hypothetical protein